MDIVEIQKRVDGMPAAMSAKGKANPEATMMINANAEATVMLRWNASPSEHSYTENIYNHVRGVDISELLDNADQIIAGLPSIEQARMSEFTAMLAQTIEIGRQNGIEVAFINPLTEAMKRLSENALTYQQAAE